MLINIEDMTRIESMFAQNPNKNIIEDRVQTDEVSKKKIELILTRIQIIFYLIIWMTKMDSYIH